jgi:hypothetical protein
MDPQKQNNIPELKPLDMYNFENLFNVYKDKKVYFYNLLNTVNFPDVLADSYFQTYTVPYDNITWTDISNKQYATPQLWWLICSVNKIDNPIEFPKAGTVLKILDPRIVTEVLQSIKQQ